MNNVVRFVPLVLLLLYIVVKVAPHIPTDTPDDYEPSDAEQRLLEPVVDAVSGDKQAAEQFSKLYGAIALVVSSDNVVLRTTDDVRRAHENAGALAIQAGEIPRIPGYAEAVNEFLSEQIGTDNVPLDSDKKKQITEAFRALEWATSQ